jgi:steroid delta-isomerase-like uncharacterized protein
MKQIPADDAKKLVSKYIEEVWNNLDLGALNDLTTTGYTYHFGSQPPRDKAAPQQFLQSVHLAFPDWRVQIQVIIAESDTVAVRWKGSVTHEGVFHGIPPTGKKISVSGINIYQIDEGKIAREWEQMDSLSMLQQLGVLPPPKSRTD